MKNLLLFLLILFSIDVVIYGQISEFKPSGNLWGYCFGDYYYMTHSDSLGRGAGNVQYKPYSTTSTLNGITGVTVTPTLNAAGDITKVTLVTTKSDLLASGTNNFKSANAFQLRRFYLGYDYNFAPKFTAYAVLADEQDLDASGYNAIYLKFAYVKWTEIFPMTNLMAGQLVTPTYAPGAFTTEPLMGYRAIERTIIDMHNNDNVSDLGIELEGNLWKKASTDSLKPNLIGYIAEFGNGNNAKPAIVGFKDIRVTVYSSLLSQKLTFGIYGDFHTVALSPLTQMEHMYKAYFNFKSKLFKIGSEIFTQDWTNSVQLSSGVWRDCQMFGWSVYTSGKILENLNYFARLDIYNPDIRYHNSNIYVSVPSIITPSYTQTQTVTTTLAPFSLTASPISQAAVFSRQTFYTIALDYTPTKRFHIMPNIWVDDFKSLVNVPSGASHAKFDYDFVPRITFYYIFNSSKKVQNNGMDN